MGIKNWVRLRAPKASQLDSLAQQKIKSLHPKKATETWFQRSVLNLKKFGVWLTSFRSNLGSRIPGVQLRTRNVVTRNIDNFMTGKGIEAHSDTGVFLEPEDKEFASQIFGTGAVFDDGKLMALDKETLQKVEKEFDDVNSRFTRQSIKYDRDQFAGRLTDDDTKKMADLEGEFVHKRNRYTRATALAIKLDMSQMNQKLRSATSMQHLLKAQARAMAFNPEDFNESFGVARSNVASFDSAQRDIDRRIVELGETYRKMVYQDVVGFLDDEQGDFSKLVGEQSLRYLVKGTDKMRANTDGVRLPGLDWYVKCAAEGMKTHPEYSDGDVVQKAAAMMYKDWSLFHDQVQAQIDSIRTDGPDGAGSFNPSRMSTYHHAQSYMSTLDWLEKLGGTNSESKIDKAVIRNVTTDYGDELGFGLRVDKADSDAAVLAKYGMSSFDKDYLSEKMSKGVSRSAQQASQPVVPERNIIQDRLVDDSVPAGNLEPPPPYSPTTLDNKSVADQLLDIDFGTPTSAPTPRSDSGIGSRSSSSSDDDSLISFDDDSGKK